jgi:hypothetical protein
VTKVSLVNLCVVDRYVAKKERDLLEYSKILESIISLEENNMWHSKKEFSVYVKEIIKIYADNFYFDNNSHRSNPIDYSNDNINFVLRSIIDYFKLHNDMEKIKIWKNETFLLSVIICTACYVDFATNVVDGNFFDTRSKFKYLLNYFSKTKILKISNNKYWINDLFDAIKRNTVIDSKFLAGFTSDSAYNEYYIYSNNPLYYGLNFKYTIQDLEDKDFKIVEKVRKEYEPKFLEISYDLLQVKILEDLISNDDMKTYLIEANPILLKKTSLAKSFDNRYLRDYVKLVVPYKEASIYESVAQVFSDVIYKYDNDSEISINVLKGNSTYVVSQEFMDNNETNKLSWENKNIKFIIKNKEDN